MEKERLLKREARLLRLLELPTEDPEVRKQNEEALARIHHRLEALGETRSATADRIRHSIANALADCEPTMLDKPLGEHQLRTMTERVFTSWASNNALKR